jgi:DNA invertase Pin-like site-specific DNA recombinase
MGRAAIYLRRSEKGEEDKNSSIETQRSETTAQAEKNGHTVIEEYSDPGGRSMTLNRPMLNRLMLDAKLGKFDVVLVWKWDRFSRELAQATVAIAQLKSYGIEVKSVHEQVPDDAIGTLMRQVYLFAGQRQRESTVLNIRAGKKARIARGHLNSRPRPLYGYMWADENHERYIPNPETAPIVQRIFRMALERVPLYRICTILDEEGVHGKSSKPSRVGPASESWRRSGISKILNNPAYMGHMITNRMETYVVTLPDPETGGYKDVLRSRPRSKDDHLYGEYGPDTCPPLVTEDEWQTIQRLLDRNRKESSRRMRHPEDALLRAGFARCGYCGRSIVCAWNKDQGAYRYRCCSVTRGLGCEGRSFSWTCRELDTYVWDWTARALSDEHVLRDKYERWKQLKSYENLGERDQLNAARAALKDAQERYDSYGAEIGTTKNAHVRATLIKNMEDADSEIQIYHAGIAKLEETLADNDERGAVLDDFMNAAARWAGNIQTLDFDSRRRVLDAFGIRAVIRNKKDNDAVQMEWALGEMEETLFDLSTTGCRYN